MANSLLQQEDIRRLLEQNHSDHLIFLFSEIRQAFNDGKFNRVDFLLSELKILSLELESV